MLSYEEKRERFADRIYPATITPFTEDNRINRKALKELMELNCHAESHQLF